MEAELKKLIERSERQIEDLKKTIKHYENKKNHNCDYVNGLFDAYREFVYGLKSAMEKDSRTS